MSISPVISSALKLIRKNFIFVTDKETKWLYVDAK
jgi:hypothetical protein